MVGDRCSGDAEIKHEIPEFLIHTKLEGPSE